MKKLLLTNGIVAALLLVLSSCQRDSDAISGNEALLTRANGWKATAMTIDNTNDGVDNGTNAFLPCHSDNKITYYTNGTASIDVGTNICQGETSGNSNWSWANSAKTEIIQTRANQLPSQYSVLELTPTTFKYSFTLSGNNFYSKTIITLTAN